MDDYNVIISDYLYKISTNPPSSEKDAQELITKMTQIGVITEAAATIIMEKEFWK